MVVASRPLDHDPRVAPERRMKAKYALTDRRPRIPDHRVLWLSGDAELNPVVEFLRKFVRHAR
jgi:hypothetical protein